MNICTSYSNSPDPETLLLTDMVLCSATEVVLSFVIILNQKGNFFDGSMMLWKSIPYHLHTCILYWFILNSAVDFGLELISSCGCNLLLVAFV